jgi:hypothetical protein
VLNILFFSYYFVVEQIIYIFAPETDERWRGD